MAFSFRRMLSNINYFTKSGEEGSFEADHQNESSLNEISYENCAQPSKGFSFDRTEPDSTSKCASLNLPESLKNYTSKKGSLSDTDLLPISGGLPKKDRKKCRKLKVDIEKANKSMSENIDNSEDSSNNVENTPKHVLLDCRSAELFSERLRGFDFNRSFDLCDAESDTSSYEEENIEIESLSEQSDSDSLDSKGVQKARIKMCRKVDPENEIALPSTTPESFGDVEVDKNEEERVALLNSYQTKLEKIECFLKKLLTEFQFHIEVSKIFSCKSVVTALPGTDVSNIPKILGEVTYIDNISRGISPTGSWNIVMTKEDNMTKKKLKNQLLSMRQCIDEFISLYLYNQSRKFSTIRRSVTFDLHKGKRQHKTKKISDKKKIKHFNFPDLREAMINLFEDKEKPQTDVIVDENDSHCRCHCHSPADSGIPIKTELSDQSITSSIGNFSLDSTTLSAYSESLDLIVSYNSFEDSSLYCTLLQKAAIERITFYVQVHSIQLKCEAANQEFESKNMIQFHCPSCNVTENEENGLLKHILSQKHCEKVHFVYKTAYIKKCVNAGKEIMPSTVLNPMTMYRDDNKIVCFGDAIYACSLCFENLIVGESVLMAHCSDEEHIDRKERLSEIID